MKKIKCWLDSGASIDSCYEVEFEIDEDAWDTMTHKEKEQYAKDYAFENADWGWVEID